MQTHHAMVYNHKWLNAIALKHEFELFDGNSLWIMTYNWSSYIYSEKKTIEWYLDSVPPPTFNTIN